MSMSSGPTDFNARRDTRSQKKTLFMSPKGQLSSAACPRHQDHAYNFQSRHVCNIRMNYFTQDFRLTTEKKLIDYNQDHVSYELYSLQQST